MAVTKEEMEALLAENQRKSTEARAELVTQHKALDERITKIFDEQQRRGVETGEAKESFQKQVEIVTRVEGELEDLSKKLQAIQATGGAANDVKSLGELLKEKKAALDGYRGGNMTLIEHDGPLESKAAIDSTDASVGLLIQPLRRPGFLSEPEMPLWVRDLIPSVSISTNAVEWTREIDGSFVNAAGYQLAEGDVKPESSGPRFELLTDTVKTLAHWIPMPRQALADLPLLRSMIETKMRRGLKIVEEQELMFGAGTGGRILGIMPQATAYDATKNQALDTRVDQVRRSILQSALSLYPCDAVMLSPFDWAEIELMKTDDKAYLFSNPTTGAEPRLWGKRIVEQMGMPEGKFLTGGFASGATIYDREQITVRIAEQHANFFVRNMVVMLVEERLMLTVERPKAFVKGDFVATP